MSNLKFSDITNIDTTPGINIGDLQGGRNIGDTVSVPDNRTVKYIETKRIKVRYKHTSERINNDMELASELVFVNDFVGQELYYGEFLVDAYIEVNPNGQSDPPSDKCPYTICVFAGDTPEYIFDWHLRSVRMWTDGKTKTHQAPLTVYPIRSENDVS